MIPDRICNGGHWRSCQECWRNVYNHDDISKCGLPINPDSCGGGGYYLLPPVDWPEDRL